MTNPPHETHDVQMIGNADTWTLIFQVYSESEGWVKTTKALDTGHGCLINVATKLGGKFPNIAEAIAFVPGVRIYKDGNGDPMIRTELAKKNPVPDG